jgi:cell wall-associated NlpC family hydrolase
MFKRIRSALVAVFAAATIITPIAQQEAAFASSTPVRYTAMRYALAQAGKPYHYGGTGPSSYDCSGLVYMAYRHAGITSIPRTANDQYHWRRSHHISASQARWGDLLFETDSSGHAYHVEFVTTKYHVRFGAHHTGTDIGYQHFSATVHYVHIS